MIDNPDEQWVLMEIEYVRRETKRVRISLDGGMADISAARYDVGGFSRGLNYHLHAGKNLVGGEEARLLSWSLVAGPTCDFVLNEETICLRHKDHDGEHSPFTSHPARCTTEQPQSEQRGASDA